MKISDQMIAKTIEKKIMEIEEVIKLTKKRESSILSLREYLVRTQGDISALLDLLDSMIDSESKKMGIEVNLSQRRR